MGWERARLLKVAKVDKGQRINNILKWESKKKKNEEKPAMFRKKKGEQGMENKWVCVL